MRNHRQELGSLLNEGARLLWLALSKRGISQADAARLVGVGRSVLTHWLYCDRRPSLESAERLRKEFGIPSSAWLAPPKTPIVPPQARPDIQATA